MTTHDPLRATTMRHLLAQVVPSTVYVAVIWNPDEADRDAPPR